MNAKTSNNKLAKLLFMLGGVQVAGVVFGYATALPLIIVGGVVWVLNFILCLEMEVKFLRMPFLSGLFFAVFMMKWLDISVTQMHWFGFVMTFLTISSGIIGIYTVIANRKRIPGQHVDGV